MNNDALYVYLLFAVTIVMFGGVVTWPRWFVQSICKHRLWVLRDAVSDDILDGRLPYEHEAVRQLAMNLEYAVHDMTRVHIVDVWAWHLAIRRVKPKNREALAEAPLAGLSEAQRSLLCERRQQMMFLTMTMILLGSWIGVGFVGTRAIPKILRALVMAPRNPRGRTEEQAVSAVRDATQQTISTTRIGQEVREFVGFKVDDVAHVPAIA
jgi:hypothetical protein